MSTPFIFHTIIVSDTQSNLGNFNCCVLSQVTRADPRATKTVVWFLQKCQFLSDKLPAKCSIKDSTQCYLTLQSRTKCDRRERAMK